MLLKPNFHNIDHLLQHIKKFGYVNEKPFEIKHKEIKGIKNFMKSNFFDQVPIRIQILFELKLIKILKLKLIKK